MKESSSCFVSRIRRTFITVLVSFVFSFLFFRDNVTCHVNLFLEENSTAHAQNVLVHVYMPYYIGLGTLFDVEDANVYPILNQPDQGVTFSVYLQRCVLM